MNIGIRLEGGLGDLLLQNRFIPAIREKYPNSSIKAYFNTNKEYVDFIIKYFPFNYDSYELYNYTDQEVFLDLGFGKENLRHYLFNTPEEYKRKFKSHDVFYNLCVDEMSWLNFDLDILRYFYFFTKPIDFEIPLKQKIPNDFILTHLYPRKEHDWLGKEYISKLINSMKNILPVVCITTEENKHIYSDFFNDTNVILYTGTLDEFFELSKKCKLFVGMDSGIRYMSYHFSKPVFVFSKFCQNYGNPLPSNLIRWLLHPLNVFPVGFDIKIINSILSKCVVNNGVAIYPPCFMDPSKILQIR